jgi:hypothetical protein
MVAKMASKSTTIISSAKVKPCCRCFILNKRWVNVFKNAL